MADSVLNHPAVETSLMAGPDALRWPCRLRKRALRRREDASTRPDRERCGGEQARVDQVVGAAGGAGGSAGAGPARGVGLAAAARRTPGPLRDPERARA